MAFCGITIGTGSYYMCDTRISQLNGTEFWYLMSAIFSEEQVYGISRENYGAARSPYKKKRVSAEESFELPYVQR